MDDLIRRLKHWAENCPNEAFEGVCLADDLRTAAETIYQLSRDLQEAYLHENQ